MAQAPELEPRGPEAEYWARVAAGEVAYQRCEACGAAVFFPRVSCPSCGSGRLAWAASAGAGAVYSATTVHRRDGTYTVALVDLDEGFRVMVQLDDAEPDRPPIGRRVAVSGGERDGEPALLARLEPAGG